MKNLLIGTVFFMGVCTPAYPTDKTEVQEISTFEEFAQEYRALFGEEPDATLWQFGKEPNAKYGGSSCRACSSCKSCGKIPKEHESLALAGCKSTCSSCCGKV